MQKAKNTPGSDRKPGSYRERARSNAREILLALALTLGAGAFMIAALVPAPQSTPSNIPR